MRYAYLTLILLGLCGAGVSAGEEDSLCIVAPVTGTPEDSGVEGFFGEEILVDQAQSSTIGSLKITLNFPEGYKLAEGGESAAEIFTFDKSFDENFDIRSSVSDFIVDKQVAADKLYLKVSLYYCREGAEGLCLTQNILYKFPVEPSSAPGDLVVVYNVPVMEGG